MRLYEASLSFNLVRLGDDVRVDSPAKVVEYLAGAFAANPTQESFWAILVDRKNRAIGRVMITLGTLTCSLVHPREVFRPAIVGSASAIIIAHNHPSGDPAPNSADIQVTRQLREAARILTFLRLGPPSASGRRLGRC